MHKRYSQREIDLHARTKATEARLKKTAKVEQELQGAIAALKKPNPRMAVKELVEDAERRAAASHSRSISCSAKIYYLYAKCLQSPKTLFATLLPKVLKSWLRRATIGTRTSTAAFHLFHGRV